MAEYIFWWSKEVRVTPQGQLKQKGVGVAVLIHKNLPFSIEKLQLILRAGLFNDNQLPLFNVISELLIDCSKI